MTCASNSIGRLLLGVCVSWAAALGASPFIATQEMTSNDIYSLAGRGDTVWMVTKLGVNYTPAVRDSLNWQGYKTDSLNGALGFGDATALLCLRSGQSTISLDKTVSANRIWLHKHATGSDAIVDIGFSKADSLSVLASSVDFSAVEVSWTRGGFWLACLDGGLVRINGADNSARAVFPGSKIWFSPSSLLFADSSGVSAARFPDTLRRVISVKAQDTALSSPVLWVATPQKLWKFTAQDTAWDSVGSVLFDANLTFKNYRQVYVAVDRDSLRLFAAITVRSSAEQSDTTGFFAFDKISRSWKSVLSDCSGPPTVAFGDNGELYVASGNRLALYRQNAGNVDLALRSDAFQKRITQAAGGSYPDNINDIALLQRPDGKKSLWIASSTNSLPSDNGLFFSLDEKADEADTAAFHYVHRDKKLSSGLKESYAYPGIINGLGNAKAVFAYNLTKPSKVTIRIFDWNMDLVKTVIRDKDRPAGNDRANGRSTNAAEDWWDGTNTYGKRIAVGVYYYKISAQSGEHSFGKIIVAK